MRKIILLTAFSATLTSATWAQNVLSRVDENLCVIDLEKTTFTLGHSKVQASRPHQLDRERIGELSRMALAGIGRSTYRWDAHSLELKALMDNLCQLESELHLFGKFEIALKIGEQVLMDELEIINNFGQATGKYLVPGSFESELTDLKYESGRLSFEILVKEGDAPYRLDFVADFISPDQLRGSVYHKEGGLFGTFEGKRKRQSDF